MIQVGNSYQNQRGEDIEIVFVRENIYYGYNAKTREVTKHQPNGEYLDVQNYKLKVPTEVWIDIFREGDAFDAVVYTSEKQLHQYLDETTVKTLKVDLFI